MKKPSRKIIIWAAAILGVLIIAAAFTASYVLKRYDGKERWLYIPAGTSTEGLRDSLVSVLGNESGERAYSLWKLQGYDAGKAHGAYLIKPNERCITIARRIGQGRQTPVTAEWTDARTLEVMAQRLTANMECSPEKLLEAIGRVLTAEGYSKGEYPAAFIPAKFEFYWSASADEITDKLLEHSRRFWNEERMAKAEAMGLDPVKVATLASIVEEESAKTDERGTIARLYLNRLAKGMPLQADPTVKFAMGDPTIKRILKEHLKKQSPYNTYLNKGLPPGPIRIPDQRTLDAVLNAPDNDYIYMCARSDFSGYHDFTTDYNEHLANARRYQAELNRLGL